MFACFQVSVFRRGVETGVLIVLCSFPDEEKARQIGAILVEKQAAACVNIVPGLRSIYRWEGRVCDEAEVLGIIKTTPGKYEDLERLILELHPYDTPEVVSWTADRTAEAYARWVAESVGTGPPA